VPQQYLVHYKDLTWNELRSKPGLRGERTTTNLLSHGLFKKVMKLTLTVHKESVATSYRRHHIMDTNPLMMYRETYEHTLRHNVEFFIGENGAH